jgi:DNA primase
MSRLSPEEINNIRSSVDIVDVVGSYIPLTQKGKNYFGVCPFHDDHSPSLCVSSEKQIYTCFSCGATGNVFKFVMDYEHVSFLESVKKMADHAGLNINIDINDKKEESHSPLYEIYDLSAKLYQNNLNTKLGMNAKEYLHKRPLDDDTIHEFGIGYANDSHDTLTKLLTDKGYDKETLLESGLVIKNEYGYSDIYYDRVMFPLWDTYGRVVGFSGRIYNTTEKNFKYINTKETPIFKKGELLYNYHRARDEARRLDTIIIMEGFMDVIRAYTVGVKNVIATMGTAVTKEQATMIKHMAKNIILLFDGDAAGAKATMAASNELLAMGITPKAVRLKEDLDPDEYILKYGGDAFKKELENPISIMDFKLDYLKKNVDLSSTTDMANYVNSVMKELSKITDPVLREVTLKKLATTSNLDIDFLKKELENNAPVKEVPIVKKVSIKYSKYEKAEQALIFYMLKSPAVIDIYNNRVNYMPTERYRFLAREVAYYYKKNNNINIADFITSLGDDSELLSTLGEIEALNLKDAFTEEEINDYVDAIYESGVNMEIARLKEKMSQESDPLKKAQIANEIMELKMRSEDND